MSVTPAKKILDAVNQPPIDLEPPVRRVRRHEEQRPYTVGANVTDAVELLGIAGGGVAPEHDTVSAHRQLRDTIEVWFLEMLRVEPVQDERPVFERMVVQVTIVVWPLDVVQPA